MRAVVVMRGGLGDIVLAQRALAEVKARLGAGNELCVATEPKYADIFLCSSSVDAVHLVGGPRSAKRLRQRLQDDGVAVYNLDHPFSGQRHRRDTLHIVERIDEILGTSAFGSQPLLEIPPASFDRPHSVLTWASSSEKKLPCRRDRDAIWARFREASEQRGWTPLLVGQPADDVDDEFRFEGSLAMLCAAILGSTMYCGCDTGFSHAAAAAEVPSVICHVGYPLARCGVQNRNADILYCRENGDVDAGSICDAIDTVASGV